MKAVFADSSFWITLRDKRKRNHSIAKSLASELLPARTQLVITMMVLGETEAYFSRTAALRERILRDLWENPVVGIEAIAFAVMRRAGLLNALSFDDHFDQFGEFNVLN